MPNLKTRKMMPPAPPISMKTPSPSLLLLLLCLFSLAATPSLSTTADSATAPANEDPAALQAEGEALLRAGRPGAAQADNTTFQRFDNFNGKYNIMGDKNLRTVFLKSENHFEGRYFAELAKETLDDLDDKTFVEYRISVYAATPEDWKKTAKWVCRHGLCRYGNNRWLVQLPRIYRVFKKIGKVSTFKDCLDNFFRPLFEATLRPDEEGNREVAEFIKSL
eukprot:g2224.t1